ncbi:MAG: phosphoglycerate kinase [Gemmatimonadota bacterium]
MQNTAKRSLRDLTKAHLSGRRALVRVDFNVPIEDGVVTDDMRIRAALATIRHLVEVGARVVLASHLGRPKGAWRDEFSLAPVAVRLGELLGTEVRFVSDVVGPEAHAAVDALPAGEVLLLENVRFLPGEETNDPKMGEALCALADVYVNDAFGAAHRAHASTAAVAEAMRAEGRPAVAGFLMEKELRFLGRALETPEKPFVALIGGAKISGKIDVIRNLLPRVDALLIGGAMANTFFRALGLETGSSLVEEDRVELAAELLEEAGEKLVLPVDCVVAPKVEAGTLTRVVPRAEVPADMNILDIGPRTVEVFGARVREAQTVLWNGPMGLFEISDFAGGTRAIAAAVADATDAGATTIGGGGDTAAALAEAGMSDRVSHVSTGGGASLEFLEGRVLPGVAALDDDESEAS